MPTTINTLKAIDEDVSYIPLTQVSEMLQNSIEIPYSIRFSLKSYLDTISSKIPSACPNTKMALMPVLENSEKVIESKEYHLEDIAKSPEFQTLLSLAIPSLLYDNELSYISSPFKKNFVVQTPAFESLFKDEEWELKLNPEMLVEGFNKNIQQAGIHILNSFYGQNINNELGELLTIKNKRTKTERHFRINLRFDFIEVKNLKPLPELKQSQINFLLKNQSDLDLWLKWLPADTFEFSGFTIGNLYDITDIQVLSELKNWLTYNKDLHPQEFYTTLSTFISSFLGAEDLTIGGFILEKDPLFQDANINITNKKCLSELLIKDEKYESKGIFDHLLTNKRVMYIDDMNSLESPSESEKLLIKNGVKSYLLSPMLDEEGKIISVIEMSSKKANTFNFQNVPKLQPIFDQLIFSFENYTKELDNRITSIIQKNFTSVHPSVSWKFEKVAKKFLTKKLANDDEVDMDPIVFENVYPLYGQSDIVDSSKQRSKAIQSDLIENLEHLSELLHNWSNSKKLHLLESYTFKIDKILHDLRTVFISTDESRIVKLITEEIHPILNQTRSRYPDLSQAAYDKYLSCLDPELDIVYHKRKDFERSVTKLNAHISEFMESDEAEMQKVLPHFFEKYKTDGVEYNVYIGQSLLENETFEIDDLKNFRLWQLVNSCEVTRLVKKLGPQLDLSLTTAELIFVYNNPLSIRFRMDEKKFDVDGAYNVRYEILKKRIDKATVKGTKERLTQSGKVAIVYLTEKDKLEYLEFTDYLIQKGLIEDNIEDLELDKLQGADGLKALRIKVKH